MAIRKHYQWCNQSKKFIGNVTYGREIEIANNVIVFLINGVNTLIQIPIAYFFITSLSSEQRKTLLYSVLNEVQKIGLIVSNITFDGLVSNPKMCEYMGADFNTEDMKPFFIEPESKRKIYIIFDPSHCEKLVRNNLANRKILWDVDGGEIKWDYFIQLVDAGKENSFDLTHKVTKRHIHFKNRIMNC